MGCFISELLVPEGSEDLLWSYCQNCGCREECPFVCDLALRRASCQGRATARRLAAEADRFLETISHADDACRLRKGDGGLERALFRALCSETALIDELRAQTVKHGP